MASIKKQSLNIATKYEIIKKIESGVSRELIKNEYGLKWRSNIQSIWNKRHKITEKYLAMNEHTAKRMLRVRESQFPDVEEALIIWIKQINDKNITSQQITEKAQKFAAIMGHKNFKGSEHFVRGFKRRWDINRLINEPSVVTKTEVSDNDHHESIHINDDNNNTSRVVTAADAQKSIFTLQKYFARIGDDNALEQLSHLQRKLIESILFSFKHTVH